VRAATNSIANLIPPHAFEVAKMAYVKVEIFGPVLQVVRWGSGALASPLTSSRASTAT
jgi:delta 1-pyrroline-5-carboxylate dehydrogenase